MLATADGLGTTAIMKRTGKSKPCVWRWQERSVEEGVDGLLRDRTRPGRKARIPGKTPAVKAWLAKNPRFKLHFIPTSSSWLNLVERFFAEITEKKIRRGVFKSVAELEAAIDDDLEKNNADPKPFVWTKSSDVILAKTTRARARLDAMNAGNQALESER